MAVRTFLAWRTTSKACTCALPALDGSSVASILVSVLLPAPLRPSRPKASPSATDRSSRSTTTWVPKLRVIATVCRARAPVGAIPPACRRWVSVVIGPSRCSWTTSRTTFNSTMTATIPKLVVPPMAPEMALAAGNLNRPTAATWAGA